MKNFVLLILLLATANLYSQTLSISGRIFDAKTNKPLPHATIKVDNSSSGTTANENGDFILKINGGSYNLITTYIGYFSDTSSFFVTDENISRDIFLQPSSLSTEVIEVQGEDAAYDIIRKSIAYKNKFKKDLNEYNYDAWSKFVVKTGINPFAGNETQKDSSGLSIFGILESESKGYFKKPDMEKQIIISKRETANISRGFAIPLIVNFYDESIDLGENKIPSPVSDDAFDYYEYKLAGLTSLDSTIVYKINVINTSTLTPQFYGNIYIIDSLFALIKIDLNTNSEVITGVDNLNFKQKFSPYYDTEKNMFWMPTDVEIDADGNFAGLVKFKGSVFTIVSEYRMNEKTPKGIFDDVIVKVEKNSKKDSTYWTTNQLIKSSEEEKNAYRSIEQTTNERNSGIRFSGLAIGIGKNFGIDLTQFYKFNSVAGHQLGIGLKYANNLGQTTSNLYYGYGFADKKAKYNFDFKTRLMNDRSLVLNFSAFNYLQSPFMERGFDQELLNTAYTLLTKKERYYYYYSNGYSFNISKKIIPQIGLSLGYYQSKQTSAKVNTDYSLFKRDNAYMTNPSINDAFKRLVSIGVLIDPNRYKSIDWGDGDISRFKTTDYPVLSLRLENSSNKFESTYDNKKYVVEIKGRNNLTARLKPVYQMGFHYITGSIPYQDLLYFYNFSTPANDMTFGAMDYGEFYGDMLWYLNIENNFGKIFPSSWKYLKSIELIGFFNTGRSYFLKDNYHPLYTFPAVKTTDGVYAEAGFALANILNIVRVNLAWRLNNYKTGSNFAIFTQFRL